MNAICSRASIGLIRDNEQKFVLGTNSPHYRNNIFKQATIPFLILGHFFDLIFPTKINLFEPRLEFYDPWEIANSRSKFPSTGPGSQVQVRVPKYGSYVKNSST